MNIAVYCSAKDSIAPHYKQQAELLGQWIGQNGHTLVYGGATGGLMTSVSESAKRYHAHIIGVIPPRIIAANRLANHCDELIHAAHMADRKYRMRQAADCFICLPGSYGTLDEMMDVIASATVGEHKKPLFIYNDTDFYASLKAQIQRMKDEYFIPQEESYSPVFIDSLDQLFEALTAYQSTIR